MSFILFPTQLFENITSLKNKKVYLIEDPLFFYDKQRITSYNRNKLIYHRATMRKYYDYLLSKKINVTYINYQKNYKDCYKKISKHDIVNIYEPYDKLLVTRLKQHFKESLKIINTPHFLETKEEMISYYKSVKTKKLLQTNFYRWKRKKLNILMTKDNKPKGGKLTYDTENRKAIPKNTKIPKLPKISNKKYIDNATMYIMKLEKSKELKVNKYSSNMVIFPIDFKTAKNWYRKFLKERFHKFGEYQDAFTNNDKGNPVLFHSGASVMFNIGLLTEKWIVEEILKYSKKHKVKINNTEGLLRQIIGWNAFCRMYYVNVPIKKRGYINNNKKLSKKWYDGSTGIEPVDNTIKKAFHYGYLHHIERLMVMLNIMILSEIDYDEIYKWHMEYSLDAYDYLMVYNIYSMGYYDGGLTTTKPYISSGNYIVKMSDYKKGEWSDIWMALYYNFLDKNYKKLKDNPRMGMMLNNYKNKSKKEINEYRKIAKKFINSK